MINFFRTDGYIVSTVKTVMLDVCPTLAFSHVSLSTESKRRHKNTNYIAVPNNIKLDDDALKQVPKFKYLGSIFTEDGKKRRIKTN